MTLREKEPVVSERGTQATKGKPYCFASEMLSLKVTNLDSLHGHMGCAGGCCRVGGFGARVQQGHNGPE